MGEDTKYTTLPPFQKKENAILKHILKVQLRKKMRTLYIHVVVVSRN